MTQVLEPVGVGLISGAELKCPFEHEEHGVVENDLSNSSGKLGTRLRNGWSTRLWEQDGSGVKAKVNQALVATCSENECPPGPVDVDGTGHPYSISAHHLIPADASLPKSPLLDFMEEGMKVSGDAGYDVNGAENGVWLPTHHELSGEMKEGKLLPGEQSAIKYGDLTKVVAKEKQENPVFATFQQRYAYNVMNRTGRQFHDAHPAYNDFVIEVLKKIHASLVAVSGQCQKCQDIKQREGKLPPNHQLVLRLNSVSQRLRSYLTGPPSKWRPPLFTSRFAAELAEMS